MNIYEIKRLTSKTSPYFFNRKTMKCFGQRMSDFRVKKQKDDRYKISADIISDGEKVGETIRYFNSENNQLED